jgi:DNA-binding MarR family transcriptional regulator
MSEDDLGALLARATRRLLEAERPLLAARDLSMWEYVVLSHLAGAPVETQLSLAQAIGYDKSRLIGLLDGLESAGLLTREPDPKDRRAKVISLTAAGKTCQERARRDIRAMERRLLAGVDPADVDLLRKLLASLSATDET